MKMAIERSIIVAIGLIMQIILSLSIHLFFIEHIAFLNILFTVIGFLNINKI